MTNLRTHGMLAGASGVIFVALFGASFVVGNILAPYPFPSPFGSAAKIERFVVESQTEVRVLSVLHSLAAIALLTFAAGIAAFVRREMDEHDALPGLALAGGVLVAAFLQLAALSEWILVRDATRETPALVRALHDLTYLAGGPAHVLAFAPFVGAGSIAGMRTRQLTGWIGWLGIATAALSLLAVVALLWEPATFLLPLARSLTFAWILVVSLTMARDRRGTYETSSAADVAPMRQEVGHGGN